MQRLLRYRLYLLRYVQLHCLLVLVASQSLTGMSGHCRTDFDVVAATPLISASALVLHTENIFFNTPNRKPRGSTLLTRRSACPMPASYNTG